MLSFRDGAPGTRFASDAMAAYLTEQQASAEMAAYYGGHTSMPRQDMHPAVAALLGIDLSARITKEELSNLLSGLRADGAKIEGKQNQRATLDKGKVSYIDFTWSAPKSFSVALELASTTIEREALERCHVQAVDQALAYVATQMGEARRGRGGSKGAESGEIAWIKFEDYVARPTVMFPDGSDTIRQNMPIAGDMQRHTHVIVPNVVRTESGHVGSLNQKRLNGRVKEFGAIYQAFLATELRAISVDAVFDKKTEMGKLVAIPREVVEEFSKRTVNGEATARAWAADNGLDWDKLDARRRVELLKHGVAITKKTKMDGHEDRAAWRAQAAAMGYDHQSVLRPGMEQGLAPREERLKQAYDVGLTVLEPQLDRRARFEGQALRTVAAKGMIASGIADPAHDIRDLVQAYGTEGVRQAGTETSLIWGKAAGEEFGHYTTAFHVKQEEEAIALLRAAADDRSTALTTAAVGEALTHTQERTGKTLNPEQRAMVHAITEGGRFTAVIGSAGTGKTTLLEPAVAAWHAAGRNTVGISLQNITTQELRDAGFQQVHSVFGFIRGHTVGYLPTVGAKTVVVLDEVAKVGTAQMLELARLQAKHGFQLVAMGDNRQCAAISAGESIRLFEHVLGEGAIPELTRTIRQERARDQETALMFREGRALEALERKQEDRTLRIVPGGPEDAIKAGVALWEARVAANAADPKYSIGISVPTNADTRAVADAVRPRLRAAGTLGADLVVLSATDQMGTEYDLKLAIGDQLRLYNRVWGKYGPGRGVSRVGDNGSVVTVTSVSADGLSLRTAKGKTASVPWAQFQKPELTGDRIRLGYGYALTIDAIQGKTLSEHITIMPQGSQAVTGFKAYTAESRHRRTSWIVTSQGAELRDLEARRPLGDARNQITARARVERFIVENMGANLSRQDAKVLAVDFLRAAQKIREGTVRAMKAVWHQTTGVKTAAAILHQSPAMQMPAAVVARREAEEFREALARNREMAAFFTVQVPAAVAALHGLGPQQELLPPMTPEEIATRVVAGEISYSDAEALLLRDLAAARARADEVIGYAGPDEVRTARAARTAIVAAAEKRIDELGEAIERTEADLSAIEAEKGTQTRQPERER